jgi:putative oxidoreductase
MERTMATLAATTPAPVATRAATLLRRAVQALSFMAQVGDPVIRLWVANVFWTSGLTKIQSFETILQLFQYEYAVPLLHGPGKLSVNHLLAKRFGF